ncbi:hypothetical protein Chor_015425 [Crotalus horridus]
MKSYQKLTTDVSQITEAGEDGADGKPLCHQKLSAWWLGGGLLMVATLLSGVTVWVLGQIWWDQHGVPLWSKCTSVPENRRFDCYPERSVIVTRELCESRGCCFVDGKRPLDRINGVPWCFYPPDFASYTLGSTNETDLGLVGFLTRERKTYYPKDIEKLQLSVEFETDSRLHVKIADAINPRYEVPLDVPQATKRAENPLYSVEFCKEPFGLIVKRRVSGTVLLNTTVAPLFFADQFLQISTVLPSTFLYGLGEHQSDLLHNLEWNTLPLWARDVPPSESYNLYGVHPFYLLMEKDGAAHGVFLLNSNLMGFPAMPPFWGLGFHLCRWGYGTSNETWEIVKAMRNFQIPQDAQWNDIDYMNGSRDFTVDSEKFASLPQMVEDLHKHGQSYVLIVDPGISSTQPPGSYWPYDEGLKRAVFINNTEGKPLIGMVWPGFSAYPDFTNPTTHQWWLENLKHLHTHIPFDGVWIDMNEPSNFIDGSTESCPQGDLDNPPYMPGLLSFSLFGVPLVGADICGFLSSTTEELCVRWTQLGAFYPFSRNHNTLLEKAQDPTAFSPAARTAMKAALELRYTLLPLLYSLFHWAHLQGDTVARPLFFEFPKDEATYTLDKQFLWGRVLLVTPVLEPGADSVIGYFPKGVWYDYYTGSSVNSSGESLKMAAPLNHINVHLREGTILPTQKPGGSTWLTRRNPLTLIAALSQTSNAWGDLYWDDGDSLDTFEKGDYSYLVFNVTQNTFISTILHSSTEVTHLTVDKLSVYGVREEPKISPFRCWNPEFEFSYPLTSVSKDFDSIVGHPPPGDFIALGSKGQVGESKTAATLLKPTSSGLPSERKREAASSALSSTSGLAKRPKLSSTPPLSALGRLAEAAVAEKRAISPSIKEPSVIPIEGEVYEVAPNALLDEIEAAEVEGNDDRIEGVLCGAVKQLKMNRAKPDITLYLTLIPHCKTFVENIQTAFGTKMPPKSILSHGEVGRGGGDLSAGNSPHPSVPEEEDSQSELLIAEDKMSPEQEAHLMPRYDDLAESVEEYVLDMLRDQLNRRQPMDNVSRNLLRLLTATCGYKEIRQMAVQRLEMWLQNPKLTRPAQDLLMSVCMNCNTHSAEDVEVVSNLIKIRLKPKVLLNHYMLCVRELLNAHRDNLGTVVKSVIFNELSNARNPNNMQILYTVLQHSPELAPKFLALVFQDLLTNKDDYLRASRALLREIIKQTKHEINFQAFCLGLMQERKEPQYAEMEFKDRFVIHITDLLAVSMMLSITAQVKEAGVAWDKGEKKNLEGLRAFQNQIAAIQRDAVWWLHTVVPSITKLAPKEYIHCLHKVLFTEQPETYYKWDNWPPESDRNFFLRLCSEVPILEDTLMRILVIGLSRDLPLGPADAMELADHLVKRAAAVQADDLEVLRVERIQLIDAVLNLCTYHHPENIQLPPGYQPPNLAISTLYWKAWPLLLVVAAFNPENIGLTAWEDYPTLKMLMEMVMTNNYSYPPCTLSDEETRTEMISRELQTSQREKQEILAFEGPPRRPPQPVLDQVKSLNQSLRLGHLLCRSRHPDFLLNIIQRQASSQSMPWLADLVQSSEGSLDVLPVQCLCEFLLHDAADESASGEEEEEGESKEQRAKKRQRQLLGRLQDMLLGPTADEQTTCEVLDYFLRRLSSSQVASRVLAMKGLSLVLSEGALHEKEEKVHPMEEDSWDFELLQSYQWLLRDLPKLPLFDSVRTTTAVALQQSESQDQVFLRWSGGETATMHILVVHAMVILLTLGPPQAFLVDTSEEALLLPDWLKLRMIRSEVPRLVDAALQDLEPQQLLLFVQSFGIPVSSMSKLLQYLDQTVSHDPQTLEQNIMDKKSDDAPRIKSSLEVPQGQGRSRALAQLPVVNPEADLAGILLQLFPLAPDPRWQNSNPWPLALALQQTLGQELAHLRQGGGPPSPKTAARLLKALAALLNSPHGGALVMAMHRNHVMACPLVRLLWQHQRHAPQDEAFSSLFFKVLMQMLQWLESPGVEDGLLRTQLKALAVQFSSQHRISDAQAGFLHLADALAFCHNSEVIGSAVRAIVATLKSSKTWNVEAELVSKVLEGLTKTRSPYLEELLVTLFSVATEMMPHFPASGPISVVTSLLLQCREESLIKKEAESSSVESASGLFIDWLELLDPEIVSSCPDLQQKLLFSLDKNQDSSESEPPSFRPYLLALLTHQSSWSTLHCCIRTLLCRKQEGSFDPAASLDFLWACIHMPRIWQGRDQRIPQKRREEFILRLKTSELLSLVDLILAESENRTPDPKGTSCLVTQSRLPLLLSCCHGNVQRIQKITGYLISSIQKWGKSSMGKHGQDLLLQMYLQLPELLVPVPEALLSCEGATDSSPCKVILLRHLPMIAALLHGRIHLNFQEFRQQKHLAFFLHVLGILELLQPQVFQSEHQGALWDCLLSFIQLLLSYRKSSRHLACFITKFVQFIHKYITSNAPAAVSFLQKHSDPLHDLSSDNSDLAMLKSLLAGLSLPSRAGASDWGAEDEKNDEAAAGSLPLVSVSLFTPLTPAEMAPYMKSLSRGQNVEGNIAADFLPTFMYCLGSCDFEVVQTALRNLPEYTLLCQEHAAALLQRAFLVGMYGQVDTSTQISEALKVLHMEAMIIAAGNPACFAPGSSAKRILLVRGRFGETKSRCPVEVLGFWNKRKGLHAIFQTFLKGIAAVKFWTLMYPKEVSAYKRKQIEPSLVRFGAQEGPKENPLSITPSKLDTKLSLVTFSPK